MLERYRVEIYDLSDRLIVDELYLDEIMARGAIEAWRTYNVQKASRIWLTKGLFERFLPKPGHISVSAP